MDRTQISRLRQQLVETEQARQHQLQILLGAGPMIQGSFTTTRRRCGNPTCHCAAGTTRHASKCLARYEGGKTRMVYVPIRDEVVVAEKAARYRQCRRARAALVKLAATTATLAEALQRALTEPYPVAPAR